MSLPKPFKETLSRAVAALGYKPEQVTKILLTHKHSDHSGELRSFPNAEIFVYEEELSAAELQGIANIVPVKFTDGAYYNFPETQKICDGVTYIKAKGHTNGNSIVIIENDGVAFEDLPDDWKCPRCRQPKEKFNRA